MAARNNMRSNTPRSKSKPQTSRHARNVTHSRVYHKVGQENQGQAGNYSRNNPQYSAASQKRKKKGHKIAIGVISVVLLLMAGAGTAFAMYMNSINEALKGDKSQEEQRAIADTLAPTHNFSDPFYMLLIGSDAREDSEEDGQRSDTNILVRIDPTNCVVTMLSIPRDTKIDIEGYGTNKFNAAYNFGGAASTIKEANELCNVDIAHYAEVNFEDLIELVDVVGGVEIDVPERIDDPDAGPVVIEAGPQTLNGEAALTFARSRAYADGDFTRTSNQRLLIEALATKVLSMSVTDLPGVIQQATRCVTTDLSVKQIIDLASQFKDIGKLTIYSGMVPSSTAMIGDVSYVIVDRTELAKVLEAIEAGKDPSLVWTPEMASEPDPGSDELSTSSGYYNNSYYDDSSVYDSTSGTNGYSSGNDSTYDDTYYDPGYEGASAA